jgi:hypothetical protein
MLHYMLCNVWEGQWYKCIVIAIGRCFLGCNKKTPWLWCGTWFGGSWTIQVLIINLPYRHAWETRDHENNECKFELKFWLDNLNWVLKWILKLWISKLFSKTTIMELLLCFNGSQLFLCFKKWNSLLLEWFNAWVT